MRIILFINSMNNINNTNNTRFKTKLLFGNLSNKERELYDNISKLVNISEVMRILDSSLFFVKEYLLQEFKQSSRFKIDKIHREKGVPLKESHEQRLKKRGKNSVKFSSYNRNNEEELQLSNFVEQKPKLRYFTMGSKQHPKQFENWSPEEMYNWWLELRTSGIPKSEWKILDVEFFLFINQISCICNSYIRYGIKNNSKTKNVFKEELELLKEYFRLLEEFYKSGGEYGLLINTHIAFCYWFQFRFGYDKQFIYLENKNQTNNITKIFNNENNNKFQYTYTQQTKNNVDESISEFKKRIRDLNSENNFSLILFTSYFQNPSKFISLYSIPVITAVGIPNKNHNQSFRFYSPFSQIDHDILGHNYILLKYLIHLYNQQNQNDMYDINIFRKKKIFLQLLHNKRESDAKILFWFIIHELEFAIEYSLIDRLIKKNKIETKKKILSKYSFLNKNYEITDKNISKFFDIDFLLTQLKILKCFLIELITSENKKDIVKRLLDSIDVLIETCKETINIVKNEQYNNYMRNRLNEI